MAEDEKTPTDPTEPTSAAPDPLEAQPVKNTADLDDISLAQALLDVDVANARVIDLTKRLTTLTKELRKASSDLQKAKLRNRRMAAELDEIKTSRSYRSASAAHRMLGAARSRLGR
jgi:predicted  nucleic acid-binding Zn-ribbon protein